jgi:gas vesicle protein
MRNGDYSRSDYQRSQFACWSALWVGTFIGAGLAFLFAPQTGCELRGMLRKYAAKTKDEVLERGREAWDIAMERGQEALQQASQSAGEYMKSGRDRAEEAGGVAAAAFKEGP